MLLLLACTETREKSIEKLREKNLVNLLNEHDIQSEDSTTLLILSAEHCQSCMNTLFHALKHHTGAMHNVVVMVPKGAQTDMHLDTTGIKVLDINPRVLEQNGLSFPYPMRYELYQSQIISRGIISNR